MKKDFQQHFLKATPEDVKKVFSVYEEARLIRRNHAMSRKGFTKDKSRRFIARVDAKALFHPEWGKYFNPEMDTHELKKNVYKFLALNPEFKTVD